MQLKVIKTFWVTKIRNLRVSKEDRKHHKMKLEKILQTLHLWAWIQMHKVLHKARYHLKQSINSSFITLILLSNQSLETRRLKRLVNLCLIRRHCHLTFGHLSRLPPRLRQLKLRVIFMRFTMPWLQVEL